MERGGGQGQTQDDMHRGVKSRWSAEIERALYDKPTGESGGAVVDSESMPRRTGG